MYNRWKNADRVYIYMYISHPVPFWGHLLYSVILRIIFNIFWFFTSYSRRNALQSNPPRHAGLCHCCTCPRSDSRWAYCEFFSLFNNVVDLLMDACWQDATQKRQHYMISQTSRETTSTWAKSASVFSFLPPCMYLPCPTLSQKVEHIVTTIEC